MTAVEAAAHLSALLVMVLRLGRTALPVLRMSNHPAAIAVCVFLPLVPSLIESLGGVATSLDLADALLLAAVNGVGAWRGRELPANAAALVFVCVLGFSATACNGESYAAHVERVAHVHAETCEACDSGAVRAILSGDELDAYDKACAVACAVRCE